MRRLRRVGEKKEAEGGPAAHATCPSPRRPHAPLAAAPRRWKSSAGRRPQSSGSVASASRQPSFSACRDHMVPRLVGRGPGQPLKPAPGRPAHYRPNRSPPPRPGPRRRPCWRGRRPWASARPWRPAVWEGRVWAEEEKLPRLEQEPLQPHPRIRARVWILLRWEKLSSLEPGPRTVPGVREQAPKRQPLAAVRGADSASVLSVRLLELR